MGFQVSSINEGLAVVLAELEDTNFTGIGISFGGGMCNVCLSYLSMPISVSAFRRAATSSTRVRPRLPAKAPRASAHQGDGLSLQRLLPGQGAAGHFGLLRRHDRGRHRGVRDFLSKSKNVPRLDRPIPVVISGGSAMPPGFRDRFEKLFRGVDLPIKISEIRMSKDPLNATAKGALVSLWPKLKAGAESFRVPDLGLSGFLFTALRRRAGFQRAEEPSEMPSISSMA